MLITLYKIGEVHFRLLGTSDFHVKANNERITQRARVVVTTSNMKISRRRLADYVKTLHQKACCTIIFLHSTNQIIDLQCRSKGRGRGGLFGKFSKNDLPMKSTFVSKATQTV